MEVKNPDDAANQMTLPSRREVILHVADGPAGVQRAVETAAALEAADPEVDVRVIVNGPALTGLTGDTAVDLPDHTPVAACSLGLERRDIERDELRPGVVAVPSAVVAIVEAQKAGARYVRV